VKALSVKQVREIDAAAIQEIGIPARVMMENAGIRIADFILELLQQAPAKKIAVFCGKGNNAGDGLVVSRQLLSEAVDVDTFLLAPADSLSPEARQNLAILKKISKKIRRIKSKSDLQAVNASAYGLLVDAIFGTGLKGKVGGIFKSAIEWINASKATIVSVDIPSGLDADKGCALGIAVKAGYTVSLLAPKKGMLINQGPQFTGRLIIKHIGFPLK
jgi:hydroxyethylthiazole kinase-like uncharacterized protein yjeF